MNRLKELRIKKGVYQKDVAQFLGVDRTTYVKYENGDSEPNNEILKSLSKYFDVSIDYILGNPSKSAVSENKNFSLRTPEEEQELNEYLEAVRTNPELRMMFSLTKNAKKEDVEKAVQIIKTLLGK